MDEFRRAKAKVRPVVEQLMEEAVLAAENLNNDDDDQTETLFGDVRE
ncbi:hypothetical protein [Gracilibacillus timonensis]|nr:hypothetical protein [Gracilibacillus timonensis]